jgi:16S rRNA (uracil1498-N3)-methyltransferase
LSRPPRLYLDPSRFAGDEAPLDGEAARRLASVLRMKAGDALRVFDGLGAEREARIASMTRGRVALALLERCADVVRESPAPVTLACAFPRGQRGDWIVEKATELGVSRIVALGAGRSVLEPGDGRLDRWRRIAIEAAEQCGRAVVPAIGGAAGAVDAERLLVADPGARGSVREALDGALPVSLAVYIGPEGGWSDGERAEFERLGATAVSLGPRILRVETAAVAALAQVMASLEAAVGAAR